MLIGQLSDHPLPLPCKQVHLQLRLRQLNTVGFVTIWQDVSKFLLRFDQKRKISDSVSLPLSLSVCEWTLIVTDCPRHYSWVTRRVVLPPPMADSSTRIRTSTPWGTRGNTGAVGVRRTRNPRVRKVVSLQSECRWWWVRSDRIDVVDRTGWPSWRDVWRFPSDGTSSWRPCAVTRRSSCCCYVGVALVMTLMMTSTTTATVYGLLLWFPLFLCAGFDDSWPPRPRNKCPCSSSIPPSASTRC